MGTFVAALRSGLAEFSALYTWRSWTFGWLGRVMSQAVLYGLLGRQLGTVGHQRYLFIGGAVLVCATEAILVCAATINEARAGTLSLIVAGPTPTFLVLLGREALWLPGGVVTSLVCLCAVGSWFGVAPTPGAVALLVPLVIITSVATYCLGFALGTMLLAAPELRNVVATMAGSAMAVVCGVVTPSATWPPAVQAIGAVVPLTHSLTAIRSVLDHGPASTVVTGSALALASGVAWLGVAALALHLVVNRAARRGSLELGT